MDDLLKAQLDDGGLVVDNGLPTRIRHFGDPAAEYQQSQTGCVCIDLTGLAQLRLTGTDRAKFLHNFCTNDIKALAEHTACEAYVTNVKARVLACITVGNFDDALEIFSDAGMESSLAEHLDRYLITEDVTIEQRTESRAALLVAGPKVASIRRELGLMTTPSDSGLTCGSVDVAGVPTVFVSPWKIGADSMLLTMNRADAKAIWDRLRSAGAVPAGGDVFETLRIAAGIPRSGVDVDDSVLAPEAGRIEQNISYRKGCYLGQEPIARIDALGHVNRTLTKVIVDSQPASLPATVLDPATEKSIGTLTSSSERWTEPGGVALGLLRSSHAKEGTEVIVESDGKRCHGVVRT